MGYADPAGRRHLHLRPDRQRRPAQPGRGPDRLRHVCLHRGRQPRGLRLQYPDHHRHRRQRRPQRSLRYGQRTGGHPAHGQRHTARADRPRRRRQAAVRHAALHTGAVRHAVPQPRRGLYLHAEQRPARRARPGRGGHAHRHLYLYGHGRARRHRHQHPDRHHQRHQRRAHRGRGRRRNHRRRGPDGGNPADAAGSGRPRRSGLRASDGRGGPVRQPDARCLGRVCLHPEQQPRRGEAAWARGNPDRHLHLHGDGQSRRHRHEHADRHRQRDQYAAPDRNHHRGQRDRRHQHRTHRHHDGTPGPQPPRHGGLPAPDRHGRGLRHPDPRGQRPLYLRPEQHPARRAGARRRRNPHRHPRRHGQRRQGRPDPDHTGHHHQRHQ